MFCVCLAARLQTAQLRRFKLEHNLQFASRFQFRLSFRKAKLFGQKCNAQRRNHKFSIVLRQLQVALLIRFGIFRRLAIGALQYVARRNLQQFVRRHKRPATAAPRTAQSGQLRARNKRAVQAKAGGGWQLFVTDALARLCRCCVTQFAV